MRARRAAAIEAAAPLRDAAELLGPAVDAALSALDLGPEHAAAEQLARGYARIIDQARDPGWGYRWIGPELLRVLSALQATPAAVAAVKGAKPSGHGQPSRLAQLRAANESGKRPGL
jgi:hypothetical protein